MLLRYLGFLLESKNEHSIHSPFVFDLYTAIIKNNALYYAFEEIEACRNLMLSSTQEITVQDLGAGSKVISSPVRRIKDIAATSLKNAQLGQLLFRLVNYFTPTVIFDLGTSLGITTLYLAAPNSKAQVYTFEGCPQTMSMAEKNFLKLGYSHIKPITGDIDQILPIIVADMPSLDFVFFDANHRFAPTLHYFDICLKKAHPQSVFVFDDIYWSKEMMQAWEAIKKHPQVMLTIDLFHVGLVFFRQNQPKQHFVLRF